MLLCIHNFIFKLLFNVLVNLSEIWSLMKRLYMRLTNASAFLSRWFRDCYKSYSQISDTFKTPVVMGDEHDKEILKMVARTTLRTKLYEGFADQMTDGGSGCR